MRVLDIVYRALWSRSSQLERQRWVLVMMIAEGFSPSMGVGASRCSFPVCAGGVPVPPLEGLEGASTSTRDSFYSRYPAATALGSGNELVNRFLAGIVNVH